MTRAIAALFLLASLASANDLKPLQDALQRQAQHESVEVTFRQTKKSPALDSEIKTMGKLWLVPRESFRWELGQPAKKVVIFNGGDVFVLNQIDKTAQRFSRDHKTVKPLFLTLGMGEDANFKGLEKAFEIIGTNQGQGRFVAKLSPKVRGVRKMIKSLLMQVNLEESFLERVGWVQRDGTETMTEFFKPTLNQKLPKKLFSVAEGAYTWKE